MLNKLGCWVDKWVTENFSREASKRATSKPFCHLLIDLDPQTDPKVQYGSNCSGEQPSVFYISTNLTRKIVENEAAQLLYS